MNARILAITLFALFCVSISSAAPYSGTWIRVDTQAWTTEVWHGNERQHVFERVAFGRGGISDLHLNGDRTTPRGEFRVIRINNESRFHVFIGLDYPTLTHIDKARRRGLMDEYEYRHALDHGARHGYFPQDGTLGGYIGFHGIGEGDPEIHERFHWTQGCIAMTNEQIEQFQAHIKIGTRVLIE